MTDQNSVGFDDRMQVLELLSRDTSGGGLIGGESCSKLLGLGLQNFQAITEPAFLPFGRLTLLYGPNSAGKSAVSDALELWRDFGRRDFEKSQRAERLSRWANFDRIDTRREGSRYVGGSDQVAMWIAVGGVGEVLFYPDEDDGLDSPKVLFRTLTYDKPYAIRWLSNGSDPRGVALWIGSDAPDCLVCFTRDANGDCAIKLNLAHPSIPQINKATFKHIGQSFVDEQEQTRSDDTSWLDIEGSYRWDGEGSLDRVDMRGAAFRGRDKEVARFSYLRAFLVEALERASDAAWLRVVHPTREVPEIEECGFVLRPTESLYSAISLSRPPTDTPWRRIAVDGVQLGFNRTIESEKLNDYLNRAMGQQSLLGLDYQIEVVCFAEGRWRSSIRGVLSEVPAFLWEEKAKCLGTSGEIKIFAHVQLLNTRGHVLQVHDVGTGVSQLIPVLEAMHFGKAVIHQPELHLHPRLQSVLGDLLIEPLHGPALWNTIVESHSEHLLLRVLRRIREACGRDRAKQPAFTPDDVVLLYFDKHDGEPTQVHRLRINAEGEFLDRWPRGFFTERDEDVFNF